MKARIITASSGIVMMCIGAFILVLGVSGFLEISKEIEEYPSSPLHRPGSSVPYPSFDGTWQYFEVGIAFFVAGGLFLIFWKKRK